MGDLEFDGKDLDEALATAAAALGRPVSEIDYELVEGGRKGVFGLGARPVRVRVAAASRPAEGAMAAPEPPAAPVRESRSAPAAALATIIALMGYDLTVEEKPRDGSIELLLEGPDQKRLAARDGELISALEFVLARMGRRAWPGGPQVRLSSRGFRSEKDDEIVRLARGAATEVARSGRPRRLQPMNPYERRVVHVTVREFEGLTTVSEGDGFLKRIRVEKIAT